MALLDEARAQIRQQGPRCSVGILKESLDPGERAELEDALASSVGSNALSRAMRERGWDISGDTLQRHRSDACRCR